MAELDLAPIRERWVGKVFQELDITADGDRMLEWALAVGETDPRFVDPEHPDFQASTSFPAQLHPARMLPEDFHELGSGRGIDGGKVIRWHRPMRPGQQLHVTVEISDIYAKTGRSGTMVFIVNRMSYYDADGQLVCEVDSRSIRQDV
jgi:hypothetical protein